MNNIDKYLLKYKNQIDSMNIKQGPTSEQIYQELCTYSTDKKDLSNQVSHIISYLDKQIQNIIKVSLNKKNTIDLIYINKNQGNYNKHLCVHFHKNLPSITESIKIYLSIDSEAYEQVGTDIIKFLIYNKINFDLRLSKINRNDNFVLALYYKQDINKTVNYIRVNFKPCLKELNPFIYQIDNIGIVKEISSLSYNKYVSLIIQDYIEECILKQQKNPYTSSDLQRFIALKCQEENNYKDKVMSYNIASSIYCILCKEDILKCINDKYNIDLDLNILNKFKIKQIDNNYHYYADNEEVDFKTKVYLNALECLIHLYKCRYDDQNIKNYKLNHSIVNIILKDIDDYLKEEKMNIIIEYTSKKVQTLISYLYGYIALKYKGLNEQEVLQLIKTVNKKIIVLERQDNNYYYKINNQTIISSIPIIKLENGFIAIEYIDINDNLVNISIIKNGTINNYLNIYIDIDKIMIKNNNNYYGRLYRSAIGESLLDNLRNDKALMLRQTDFKAKFLSDHSKEVNKYVNINLIKKIFYKNSNNKIVNNV